MTQYAGIDIGQNHTFSCIVDVEQRKFHFPPGQLNLADSVTWLQQFPMLSGACLDGPPTPNTGALGARLRRIDINTNRRVTEFQLGIGGCYSTRSVVPTPGDSNYWMHSAFDLFGRLVEVFGWTIDKGQGEGQLIETHPTYAFKALLGCGRTDLHGIQRLRTDPLSRLRPKGSQAGHAQRIQLIRALCEEINVGFDEHLLQQLEMRIDWVDAAICAFMSYWHQTQHDQLESPGDQLEGAIFLRIPQEPFSLVEDPDSPLVVARRRASDAIPQYLLNGVSTPANAIILRLGDTAQLSQLDTIDTVLSSLDSERFWFPCVSKAMPRLARNLARVGGRLFLSWGPTLRVSLRITEVIGNAEKNVYPEAFGNPWPMNQCRFWLRVADAAEIAVEQFLVNQNERWTQGFGQGQTALLWAIVPENDLAEL